MIPIKGNHCHGNVMMNCVSTQLKLVSDHCLNHKNCVRRQNVTCKLRWVNTGWEMRPVYGLVSALDPQDISKIRSRKKIQRIKPIIFCPKQRTCPRWQTLDYQSKRGTNKKRIQQKTNPGSKTPKRPALAAMMHLLFCLRRSWSYTSDVRRE